MRASGLRVGWRLLAVVVDQAPGDPGDEQCLAGGDDLDGVEQVCGQDVLEEESAGTGAQRAVHVLVGVEGGEDQHPYAGRGRVPGEAPGRRDAVEAGHPDVHQHHVGPRGACHVDGRQSVLGLAHHLEVGVGAQECDEAASDQGLVLGDGDPDGTGSSITSPPRWPRCGTGWWRPR